MVVLVALQEVFYSNDGQYSSPVYLAIDPNIIDLIESNPRLQCDYCNLLIHLLIMNHEVCV
jgi:hypothetical protein